MAKNQASKRCLVPLIPVTVLLLISVGYAGAQGHSFEDALEIEPNRTYDSHYVSENYPSFYKIFLNEGDGITVNVWYGAMDSTLIKELFNPQKQKVGEYSVDIEYVAETSGYHYIKISCVGRPIIYDLEIEVRAKQHEVSPAENAETKPIEPEIMGCSHGWRLLPYLSLF
jgi:hypothetical protein